MNRPHYFTFDIKNYADQHEMFNDVATMLRIMVTNDYACSLRYEDCGIYVMEYDYADEELAEFTMWSKPDEDL